jgi:hypothetical protein
MRFRAMLLVLLMEFFICCAPLGAQSHSVSLKWTASVDAGASYNIYRLTGTCPVSGTGGFSKISATPVSGTTFNDAAQSAGTYCYYVTAVLNGAESLPSNLAAAVILPGAPTSLQITGTN